MTAALSRPEAILFDWDNTLIDSWEAIHDAQNHVFAYFGMRPWTLEEVRARVRGSMRDSYPILFGDRWREAGAVFYARFTERHLEAIRPLPGAAEMLQDLNAAGLYLAVVSNKLGDYLRLEVEALGWQNHFRRVVGAFDAANDKPSVDPIEMALSGSGIACGGTVWLVGDADVDLECAVRAGCVPVLLREQAPGNDEFAAHPPAVHARTCMALCKVVLSL